jgi:DNA polymerase elongation subunit (family B)
MELELEKVYQPCMLVEKKRYVGYSYESEGQAMPTLDAKGIEMVRRDQCGLTVRAQEEVIPGPWIVHSSTTNNETNQFHAQIPN